MINKIFNDFSFLQDCKLSNFVIFNKKDKNCCYKFMNIWLGQPFLRYRVLHAWVTPVIRRIAAVLW